MAGYTNEIARITDVRIQDPDLPLRQALRRVRRPRLTEDGKLAIVAADHPARRVTGVGSNPLAMADRGDYLARILRVLESDQIDGVMATMDVLEELLIVSALRIDQGQADPLAGKVLIGSMNRGGLAGVSWEMDDPVSGVSAAACSAWKLDGAKLLLRLHDQDEASLRTLVACAEAIDDANALELPMFLEPLPVVQVDGAYKVVKEPEALAKIVSVSSALGNSSRRMWLKLPYCPGYEAVARATTLPILLLGGESAGNYRPFLDELAAGMAAGTNVRGALVGRNVLYPGDADPLDAANAVGSVIHSAD